MALRPDARQDALQLARLQPDVPGVLPGQVELPPLEPLAPDGEAVAPPGTAPSPCAGSD